MSFLFSEPLSLRKMASVVICGSLWRNDALIRNYLHNKDLLDEREEMDEQQAAIEIEIIKNLPRLGIPDKMERELYPVIREMGRNFLHFPTGVKCQFDSKDRTFFAKVMSQVCFTNRGDVDSFATTKRHLQEGGALSLEEPGDVFSWAAIVADPEIIKSELKRNKEQLHSSLKDLLKDSDHIHDGDKCERFWMRYGEDSFPSSNARPFVTTEIFNYVASCGYEQGIDFTFSLLTKSDQLSHIKRITTDSRYVRTHHQISPFGWAHLILKLQTTRERESFYREYGHSLLHRIFHSWTYRDLYKAAVVELVNFLSVEQFEYLVNGLAALVSNAIRPYDKTLGDIFVFFWESASDDLRSEYIQSYLDDSDFRKLLISLAQETMAFVPLRCFALVVSDMKRLNVLRSFLLSDEGLILWGDLIKARLFECLKFFRSHVSVAQLALKLEKRMKVDVFELYHWIHGDY